MLLFRSICVGRTHFVRGYISKVKLNKSQLKLFTDGKAGWRKSYCTTNIPYENEETKVEYKNGLPTVSVMLPSKDERCLFTLKPLTDTVGSFLTMVKDEDHGIQQAAVYRKDGSKIAQSTAVNILLQEDFDLLINSRKFYVQPPQIELGKDERQDLDSVKELVSQLYTQMHLSEWQANREKELVRSVEELKHELAPYEKLKDEMIEAGENRANRYTWLALTAMGVQFGFLARLTWWEYSWDIMEPVTYFVTFGTSIVMFAYYVLTRQEYIYPDIKNRNFLMYLHKQGRKSNYDVEHYNSLIVKLNSAKEDLDKINKPLGLQISEAELQSLLHGKQIK